MNACPMYLSNSTLGELGDTVFLEELLTNVWLSMYFNLSKNLRWSHTGVPSVNLKSRISPELSSKFNLKLKLS